MTRGRLVGIAALAIVAAAIVVAGLAVVLNHNQTGDNERLRQACVASAGQMKDDLDAYTRALLDCQDRYGTP